MGVTLDVHWIYNGLTWELYRMRVWRRKGSLWYATTKGPAIVLIPLKFIGGVLYENLNPIW